MNLTLQLCYHLFLQLNCLRQVFVLLVHLWFNVGYFLKGMTTRIFLFCLYLRQWLLNCCNFLQYFLAVVLNLSSHKLELFCQYFTFMNLISVVLFWTCVTSYTAHFAILNMPFAMHQPTISTEQFLAVMVFTVSRIKISTVLALDNAVFAEIVKM